MQAKMNARLEARADVGRALCGHDAPSANSKGRSRQPESKLGDLSPQTVQTLTADMARARAATLPATRSAASRRLPTCNAHLVASAPYADETIGDLRELLVEEDLLLPDDETR